MGQWKEMQLGDFIELKRGYDLPKKNREIGDVPLVSSSGLSDTQSESKVKGPGVVTGRYGTIGQVFYIEDNFWPLNTTLYVRDFKNNDPLFVYYFMKTIKYLDYSDKAAVPGVNRNHLHKAKIHVPVDSSEQREIAMKLWTLDNKITLNRQINQTLEHIAQAIFKSWFVDFEPVKAKIQAKQNGRARQDGERSGSQRKTPNASSDATWPEAQAGAGAEGDPERAAMCTISGKTDAELDTFLEASTPEQRQQLAATAALFPDEFEDSELGLIPKGWEIKPLPELINFLEGPGIRNWQYTVEENGIKFINIRCIQNGDLKLDTASKITRDEAFGKYAHFQLSEDDIVVSTSGTLGRFAFVRDEHLPLSLNTSVIRFRPIRGVSTLHYIRGFVETQLQWELEMRASGSAQRNFGPMHLKQIRMLRPSQNVQQAHAAFCEPLYRMRQSNLKEIDRLIGIRSSLLPKLLSGEITLDRAQSKAEAVA